MISNDITARSRRSLPGTRMQELVTVMKQFEMPVVDISHTPLTQHTSGPMSENDAATNSFS